MIYKFSDNGPDKKPSVPILDKLMSGAKLSREEKDSVADKLYGTFSQHSSSHNYHGWRWVCRPYLQRILVKHDYVGWHEYYAPDKTSLRRALTGLRILEMHYIEKREEI